MTDADLQAELPVLARHGRTDDAWRRHANCTDLDPALFFPEGQGGAAVPEAAKAACAACPVRTDCLDFALTNGIKAGYWGGTSQRQRRQIRSARRRAAA